MKLIKSIYRLLVNLKQRTSRLFSLIIVCLTALFGLDPSVNADTWYVDGSVAECDNDGTTWGNAFKYLQDALNEPELVAGDEIWVAATATYYPDEDCADPGGTDNQALSFDMIAAVTVYGGFAGDETNLEDRDIVANETILSGEIGTGAHTDNSNHVVSFVSLSGSAAILDGFTVVDGDGGGFGAGIDVDTTQNAIIRNCILRDNVGNIGGGLGITNTSAGDEVLVRNCLFKDNSAVEGGGIGTKGAAGEINVINCVFSANNAPFGGGVYSSEGVFTFVNATFTENTASDGGGAYFVGSADALFINSLFLWNTTSDDGGAVYISGLNAAVVFDNCTLSKNHADDEGGGILAWSFASSTTITNCILWGNTDGNVTTDLEEEQLLIDSPATVTVTYTCIEGLDTYSPGTGNIGVDPTFVDEDGSNSAAFDPEDNFRLNYLSPCIDAADNDAVDCDEFDVDEDDLNCFSNPTEETPDLDFADRRIDDPDTIDRGNGTAPLVDMGAYEFGPCPWDLDGDCVVGARDLMELLRNWDDPYGAADLLALLADWGPCPCDPTAVVLSLDEEWEDACLTEAQWDEYVDVMTDPDSSQADKDRYDCWMTHYIEDCNRCICIGLSGCPNPDPFN